MKTWEIIILMVLVAIIVLPILVITDRLAGLPDIYEDRYNIRGNSWFDFRSNNRFEDEGE